jgi:hypothetical protein
MELRIFKSYSAFFTTKFKSNRRGPKCTITARRYVLVGVTRRQHRAESWYPRQRGHKIVTVQGGFGACFCHPGTWFCEYWWDRGTKFLNGRNIVLVQGTGRRKKSDRAVSHNPDFVKTAQSVFGKNRDKPIKHTDRVTSSVFN